MKNSRKVDGDVSIEDASLAKYFNNPELGDLELPAVILDRFGCIMVWYLPSIFSANRVVCTSAVLIRLTKCHSLIICTDEPEWWYKGSSATIGFHDATKGEHECTRG